MKFLTMRLLTALALTLSAAPPGVARAQSGLAQQMADMQARMAAAESALKMQNEEINRLEAEIRKRNMTWVRINESCPSGSERVAWIGIIFHNPEIERIDRFGFRGGGFNNDWTWAHPVLCWFAGSPEE